MDLNHSLSLNIETKTDNLEENILENLVCKDEFDSNSFLKGYSNIMPSPEIEKIEIKPVDNFTCMRNLKSNGIEINSEQGELIAIKLKEIGNEMYSDKLDLDITKLNSDSQQKLMYNSIEKIEFNNHEQLNTLEMNIYKCGPSVNSKEPIITAIATSQKQLYLDLSLNLDISKLDNATVNSKLFVDAMKGGAEENQIRKSNSVNSCKALVPYCSHFMPLINLENNRQYERSIIPLPKELTIKHPNIINSHIKNLLATKLCPITDVNDSENGLIKSCIDQLGKEIKYAQSSGSEPSIAPLNSESHSVNNCRALVPYCPYVKYMSPINSNKLLKAEKNVIPYSSDLSPVREKPNELDVSVILQEDSMNKQNIDAQSSDLEMKISSVEDEESVPLNNLSYQCCEKESFIAYTECIMSNNIGLSGKVNFSCSQNVEVNNSFNIGPKFDSNLGFSPFSSSSSEDEILSKRIKLNTEILDHDIDACKTKESSNSLDIEKDADYSDIDDIIERSIEKYESFTADKGILATPTTLDQSCQTIYPMPDQIRDCKRSLFLDENPNQPKKPKYNSHMISDENSAQEELPQFDESVSQFYITPSIKENSLVGEGEPDDDDGNSEKTMFDDQDIVYSSATHERWSSEPGSTIELTKDQLVPYSPGDISFLSTITLGAPPNHVTPKKPILRVGLSRRAHPKPLHSPN